MMRTVDYIEENFTKIRRVYIMGGKNLCPLNASRAQKFSQMILLAIKISNMHGESFHKAAVKCLEMLPPEQHVDSITFLNTLAEYDLVAARAIANFIFPSEISKYLLDKLNFI